MRIAVLLAALLFFFPLSSKDIQANKELIDLPVEKLEAEKGKVNYSLNEIIHIIEDSIHLRKKVIIPKGTTEFERLLFTARSLQHNNQQIQAINLYQNLLEFDYSRTKGEELYIKLLLAKSLEYIGATQIAYSHMREVFPELLNHIEDPHLQAFFLGHFSDLYFKLDSLEAVLPVYYEIRRITLKNKDSSFIYNCLNNLGVAHLKLGNLDSAAYYFKRNQNDDFIGINPIMYAFSFGNYGSILLEQGNLDSALSYFRREESLLKQIPTKEGLDNLYQSFGDLYFQLGKLDSATYYFQLSNRLSEENQDLSNLAYNYNELLKIAVELGKTEDVLSYLNSYTLFKDSLQKVLLSEKLNDQLKTSEFFRIFSQAQYSRESYEELKQNNRMLYFAVIALIGLIGILIFILIYRRKTRKQLAEANKNLQEKNEDLAQSNQLLKKSNERNELLLKELHHRVKNNLQIVSSLFRLQMNAHDLSAESKEVFKLAQSRIHSISLLHKKIYQSEDISTLDFSNYLQEFSAEGALAVGEGPEINIKVPSLDMKIDTALPLGLIFNELFTNSIKHSGLKDEALIINLEYQKVNGHEEFRYSDNGDQSKLDFDENQPNSQESLGRELVELLAKQIEAEIEIGSDGTASIGYSVVLKGKFSIAANKN